MVSPANNLRLGLLVGLVCLVLIMFWLYRTSKKQLGRKPASYQQSRGLAPLNVVINRPLPKDCVKIHNIFRRGLNLLPLVDFEVASLRIAY